MDLKFSHPRHLFAPNRCQTLLYKLMSFGLKTMQLAQIITARFKPLQTRLGRGKNRYIIETDGVYLPSGPVIPKPQNQNGKGTQQRCPCNFLPRSNGRRSRKRFPSTTRSMPVTPGTMGRYFKSDPISRPLLAQNRRWHASGRPNRLWRTCKCCKRLRTRFDEWQTGERRPSAKWYRRIRNRPCRPSE